MAHEILRDYYLNGAVVYIDDTIIYGRKEETFLTFLGQILSTFVEFNVRLKPSKCYYKWGIWYAFVHYASSIYHSTCWEIYVRTDHKNLVYLANSTVRWRIILSEFKYMIEHTPVTSNVEADGLTGSQGDVIWNQKDMCLK